MASERFDLLVVGAGATGAGIARDAALRGLRVALCDRGDFAGETSSHSSKLIHGGLRYLPYGDFGLVFEALSERRTLMKIAPHLCRPVSFLFPAYAGLSPGLRTLGMGITLYNALALYRPPVGGRRVSARETLILSPWLRAAGLEGAQLYVDCQTDDARLVLESALDAGAAGAVVAPRVEVTTLARDGRGRIRAAHARDVLSGETFVVEARLVVNATGPYSDVFDQGRRNLRPTLGVHLVFDAARLPHGDKAQVLRSPRDGRLVFLLPAGARTIVGTTDTDWTAPDDAHRSPQAGDPVAARASDVAYLLEVANHAFPPAALSTDEVVSTFAGLRPLIATSAHTTSATSREHEIRIERDGLVTVMGGKLTTFRRMAEQTVDLAVESLRDHGFEGAVGPCITATRPLPGGAAAPPSFGEVEMAPDVEKHLRQSYGARARAVVDLFGQASAATTEAPQPALDSRLDPELPYLWAEVLFAARHEWVEEVEDVLCRRVPVFRDARDQGLAVAAQVAALLAPVLGWTAARQAQSLDRYRRRVAQSRAWRG
ncbi:MAG TPA: glycerol-3-phosphate dehydrogenase/oxidase [Polyangia bacterium]